MKHILAPSILSADFKNLGEDIKAVVEAGAEYLHIDVMDGMFVPSISFGMPVIKSIRPLTDKTFDVHLMVQDPDRYIEDFAACGADLLTVHAEAVTHLDRAIDKIHDCGMKAGVALNPATPISVLDYVLEKTDMVLLMTVNPGFGGQKYVTAMTRKISTLRQMTQDMGMQLDIQVDGGINDSTIRTVLEAGANIIVAGSAVFDGKDCAGNARRYLGIMKEFD